MSDGTIPASWSNLQRLASLTLNHNQVVSPLANVQPLRSLVYLDLSYNNLTLASDNPALGMDLGFWFSASMPPFVQTVLLNNNQLRGSWAAGELSEHATKMLLMTRIFCCRPTFLRCNDRYAGRVAQCDQFVSF